jgi:hypothetical protein
MTSGVEVKGSGGWKIQLMEMGGLDGTVWGWGGWEPTWSGYQGYRLLVPIDVRHLLLNALVAGGVQPHPAARLVHLGVEVLLHHNVLHHGGGSGPGLALLYTAQLLVLPAKPAHRAL